MITHEANRSSAGLHHSMIEENVLNVLNLLNIPLKKFFLNNANKKQPLPWDHHVLLTCTTSLIIFCNIPRKKAYS